MPLGFSVNSLMAKRGAPCSLLISHRTVQPFVPARLEGSSFTSVKCFLSMFFKGIQNGGEVKGATVADYDPKVVHAVDKR